MVEVRTKGARGDRLGRNAAERISAGCYGALVAASTLIGLTEAPMVNLVLVVILTNVVYFATHVFAYTVGSPSSPGEGWASARHHIVVSAPMVSVTFVPIALVVVLDVLGAGRETAVVVGVVSALAYLVVVATTGAYLKGFRPLGVIFVGIVTLLLTAALVAAKLSLH